MNTAQTELRVEGGAAPIAVVTDPRSSMRCVLRCILQSRGFQCIEASGGGDFGDLLGCHRQEAALVLLSLDVEYPDPPDTSVLEDKPTPKVLVIGWVDDLPRLARALDRGADDYLIKPFTAYELSHRLDLLFARANQPGVQGGAFGALVVDPQEHVVTTSAGGITFSEEEHRGLLALAERSGRIATYGYLARRIWEGATSKGPDDVRVLVAALRKKVEVDATRPEFIKTEVGLGYRLREDARIKIRGGADPRGAPAYEPTKAGCRR